VVSSEGKILKEESLDNDVCTCCPTSVVKTARGLLVAYRDHTPEDIRDISVVRLEGGKWTAPKNINPDKWKINACPTNAAAAGAQGMPREQIVFSSDGGVTFGKPILLSTGRSFGYTSIALDEQGGALVSWLEAGGDDARILLRQVSAAGAAGPVVEVAKGSRKSLGYPRILRDGNETLVAWTSENTSAKVQTARVGK
jgi:hypothetical protein